MTYNFVQLFGSGFCQLRVQCYSLLSPVTNRRLFQVYYQTLPSGTSAFLLLSNDYNAITFNGNRTEQYSHCQVVDLFRMKSLLVKAFITTRGCCPTVISGDFAHLPT